MPIGLQNAVGVAQEHYRKMCGGIYFTRWIVDDATEDLSKGCYVVRCEVKCLADPNSHKHEVWINIDTGEIEHEHRIKDG